MNTSLQDYAVFLKALKNRILHARTSAARAINHDLVLLYWDIGRGIVEKQQTLGWGDTVVERIATDLRTEFPNIRGLSSDNLWRMRQFYNEYSSSEFLAQAVPELVSTEFLEQAVPEMDLPNHTSNQNQSTKSGEKVNLDGSVAQIRDLCRFTVTSTDPHDTPYPVTRTEFYGFTARLHRDQFLVRWNANDITFYRGTSLSAKDVTSAFGKKSEK